MPFTPKDFQDKYVLGGRRHDPSSDGKTFIDGCFTNIFLTVEDDASAIGAANESMEREFQRAKPGEHLAATLWFNDRLIKNYPNQIKE